MRIERDAGGHPWLWRINAQAQGLGNQLYSRSYGWLWTAEQLTEYINRPDQKGEEFFVETLVS